MTQISFCGNAARAIMLLAIVSMLSPCPSLLAQLPSGWKAHDLSRPAPKVVTPAKQLGDAPSDAIVLFNGEDLTGWTNRSGKPSKWKVVDGTLESVQGAGPIFSEQKFGDCQLHVEFASPSNVKGNGQGRGNSGVFLMESFEVQVLDSFENGTYADGSAGSIYGQYPPLVNASRGPGEWQSYDIIFHRPRFDDSGKMNKPATFTVLHNGVLIQDHSEAFGPTSWIQHGDYNANVSEGRLSFQDHGNPVHYRNIWVRPLEDPKPRDVSNDRLVFELTEADKKALVGQYGKLPVTLKNGRLYIKFAGALLEMVAHSKTEFSLKKSAGSVTFELDEAGVPTKCTLQLDAAGQRMGERKAE
ncbi:MAG: family 16 glycoside hydrolase [Planctomycetota bacterium]